MKAAETFKRSMGAKEWSLLITLSMIWGGSFLFVSIALRALPPMTIVFLRLVLGAVVLYAIALAIGLRLPRGWRIWAAFLGIGLLNNVIP